jgi:hypothetical protein
MYDTECCGLVLYHKQSIVDSNKSTVRYNSGLYSMRSFLRLLRDSIILYRCAYPTISGEIVCNMYIQMETEQLPLS